jgi:hypothetical protein
MSRLYDRIVRDTVVKFRQVPFFFGSPVILADNVADYVWSNKKSIHRKEFPNVAPPFERMFVEFSVPIKEGGRLSPFGFAVTAYDLDSNPDYRQLRTPPNIDGARFNMDVIQEAKWSCVAQVFLDPEMGAKNHGEYEWRYYVSPTGKMMNLSLDVETCVLSRKSGVYEQSNDLIDRLMNSMFDTVLMTTTFMHSKNIELVEQIPPAKLSRKAEKRYGQALTRYCVIKVNPMRTLKRSTGETDIEVGKSQSSRPMSIVRGHFKDFRDGKGLFGKYKDIYWWDQHVIGDSEIGVIEKDYKVIAPKEQAS